MTLLSQNALYLAEKHFCIGSKYHLYILLSDVLLITGLCNERRYDYFIVQLKKLLSAKILRKPSLWTDNELMDADLILVRKIS